MTDWREKKYEEYGTLIWDFLIKKDKKFFSMRELVEETDIAYGRILFGIRWLNKNNKITKISNKTWRVEK